MTQINKPVIASSRRGLRGCEIRPPDARRRAVASSLLHVDFWRGWYDPQGWRAGHLSPEDQTTWEEYDRSFLALAGLEWRIQMRAMEAARRAVDEARFLEIKHCNGI